jgi:transposase
MSRPTMRFVPVKTAEQQAALMMVGLRDRLIRNCTQLSNAIRGYVVLGVLLQSLSPTGC